MAVGQRVDQFSCTATLNGADLGTWDAWTGGDSSSSETKYWPGAMGDQQSLGGRKTVVNVMLKRNYNRDRDQPIQATLDAAVGKGRIIAVKQPLDPDGNAYGRPMINRGVLMAVKWPEPNSNAQTEAMIELTVSCDSLVGS